MRREGVVLITEANCDAGRQRVRTLVANAADLADPLERSQLLERAGMRLGRVKWILDGRTGSMSALELGDDFAVATRVQHPALSRAS